MVRLINIGQTIQPAASAYSPALVAFYLLAATYHFTNPQLIYCLYASGDPANTTTPYQQYFILHYNSSASTTFGNSTININCLSSCSIKATDELFLIETEDQVLLYSMQNDRATVNTSAILINKSKNGTNMTAGVFYKWADIFKNMFMLCDGNYLYFITNSPGAAPSSIYFSLPYSHSPPLSTSLTQAYAMLALHITNSSTVQLLVISCVSCVLSYTFTSGSVMPTTMYSSTNLNVTLTSRLTLSRGDPQFKSGNQISLWNIANLMAQRASLNVNTLAITQLYTLNLGLEGQIVTNYKLVVFTDNSTSIYVADYSVSSTVTTLTLDFNATITLAAISNNSQQLALHNTNDTFSLHLYMLVDNCQSFRSYQQGSICVCTEFQNYLCKSIYSSTTKESSSSGMPIYVYALIGVGGAGKTFDIQLQPQRQLYQCIKYVLLRQNKAVGNHGCTTPES